MSKLGAAIKLTTPQLRVYLSAMERLAQNCVEEGSMYDMGEAYGIRKAYQQLISCLNLPDDWETQMDKIEDQEVTANMTSEELRAYRLMVKEK